MTRRQVCPGVGTTTCGALTLGTRCPRCQAEYSQRRAHYLKARGSATARGYGSEHQSIVKLLRERVAKTHEPCAICSQPFHHPSEVSADHEIPLALGGSGDVSNYRPAHFKCNSSSGAAIAAAKQAADKRRRKTQAEGGGHYRSPKPTP